MGKDGSAPANLPICITHRLFIEKVRPQDGAFVWYLMNTPKWLLYIGDRGITSQKKAVEYIHDTIIASYDAHGYGLYKMVLKTSGAPIGLCGFVKRAYLPHADLGFALLPEYEGRGYALEAAKACLQYGKALLNLHPILALTSHENLNSQKLLLKIGFHEIGNITADNSDESLLVFSN
ncbi:MAG: GNAT family N-acetyltransferase [Maribacter sp.]|nr:GNAT family N-acetyltransferase [Maribacter sp.]